ncbi:hypothetical protein C5167_012487 [Papaver somniferum]|uniref:Uncharacterized protein n=1 Tax=Papaver somniferum TaxID=3469 RepID=A0A4Y7J1W4_PAPSO|nr:hypothetical protein C5167_012487 [Papaver somniferum]
MKMDTSPTYCTTSTCKFNLVVVIRLTLRGLLGDTTGVPPAEAYPESWGPPYPDIDDELVPPARDPPLPPSFLTS